MDEFNKTDAPAEDAAPADAPVEEPATDMPAEEPAADAPTEDAAPADEEEAPAVE